MADNTIDLGDNHTLTFVSWSPDRELNPQYDGIPDIEKYGGNIEHRKPDGSECWGFVTFDTEETRKLEPTTPKWKVESWEPLTLSPSVLCRICGDHGFIKEGKWVKT
jgi:hypothetical protein